MPPVAADKALDPRRVAQMRERDDRRKVARSGALNGLSPADTIGFG